jgi:putative hydrolase of the HAD superfamily
MITHAEKKDAQELEKLVNSAYRGDSSRQGWTTEADLLDGTRIYAEAIAELIESGTTILKYVENDEILGCVELREENEKLYLGMLSVRPHLQGKGIGKKLLYEAEKEANKHKIKSIFMTVISARKELIDWYVRHGYELTGDRKPFSFTDPRLGQPKTKLEFVVLEKKLKKPMIKVIAFDADDTLWHNETFFRNAEDKFCMLLENYLPQHTVRRELLTTEIQNIALYGYGIKAFMLSMIETAIRITDKSINSEAIEKIIQHGQEILNNPVELIDGVEEVLNQLKGKYRLVMATKGDLLDQERKLKKSGLENYFHHIEIMTEKKEPDFEKLIRHLDIPSNEFAMVGNSLKSDILPVLNLGGHAFHIPYHVTWAHERVESDIEHENFKVLNSLFELLTFL